MSGVAQLPRPVQVHLEASSLPLSPHPLHPLVSILIAPRPGSSLFTPPCPLSSFIIPLPQHLPDHLPTSFFTPIPCPTELSGCHPNCCVLSQFPSPALQPPVVELLLGVDDAVLARGVGLQQLLCNVIHGSDSRREGIHFGLQGLEPEGWQSRVRSAGGGDAPATPLDNHGNSSPSA